MLRKVSVEKRYLRSYQKDADQADNEMRDPIKEEKSARLYCHNQNDP